MSESSVQLEGKPGAEPGHPQYCGDPMLDHLLDIVVRLGAELWVLRDRQAVIEHLLATRGAVTTEMIEQCQLPPELAAQLRSERQALLDRVYGGLYAGLGAESGRAFEPSVLGVGKSKAR